VRLTWLTALAVLGDARVLQAAGADLLPSLLTQVRPAGPKAPLRAHSVVRMAGPDAPCQDEEAIRADAVTAFRLLDLDGNGSVSRAEFEKYLSQFRYTASAADKVYEALDMDNCGEINLKDLQEGLAEYCRCEKCEPKFVEATTAEADAMFDLVDANGDGEIKRDELRAHLLKVDYTEEAADAVFDSLKVNDGGAITREELREGFLKYAMLRQAMTAVVTTLVKRKNWSPMQSANS